MPRPIPALVVLVALALASPGSAQAQTRWAVLSASSARDDAARAHDVAELALAALEAQGETVLARERASARLEANLSRAFAPAPEELAERIARAAETVLEDVAFGRNARAHDAGEPMLEAAEDGIVGLARTAAARDVGNLCLFLVRADLQERRRDEARARIERCLRLMPALDADERVHPPNVRELLAEARQQLDLGTIGGILSVQGAASEPDGCAIRVNGSEVGRTPWARIPLPAGSYGVQVECDPAVPGRVFRADVEQGQPSRLTIGARLSQALDTSHGSVALVYTSPAELADRIAADVAQLGRSLDVDRVLVGVVDGGTISVRAFEVITGGGARLTGSAPVAEPIDTSSSLAAVERARSGRLLATAAEGSRTDPQSDSTASGPARTASGGDVAVAVLGGSLLTVGVVGLGIGWYFWTEIDARGQELNRATTPSLIIEGQRAFDDAEVPFIITGAAGGVLSSVGAALLTSQSDEAVPWWSWAIGAAGLGVAAVGVYFIATEGACYGNDSVGTQCLRRSPNTLLGAFVLEHAAPLLAVPVTSWIRAAISSGGSGTVASAATLRVDAHSVRLSWFGSF